MSTGYEKDGLVALVFNDGKEPLEFVGGQIFDRLGSRAPHGSGDRY